MAKRSFKRYDGQSCEERAEAEDRRAAGRGEAVRPSSAAVPERLGSRKMGAGDDVADRVAVTVFWRAGT
jgi:hypothetical protein